MTSTRKFLVLLAAVVGILVVLAVVRMLQPDYGLYPKVFYEYKEKGKNTQFKFDDVQKGFK